MTIRDYLPKFHVVEANNLKGLQPGFVVAQTPVKGASTIINSKKVEGKKFVENGHLCMLAKGSDVVEVDLWKSDKITEQGNVQTNPVMYIAYTEPLNTVVDNDQFYAADLDEELPRFVQLIPGDEWTTDIDYNTDSIYTSVKTELLKHVVEIKKGNDWYTYDRMADGVTKAHHYMYIG